MRNHIDFDAALWFVVSAIATAFGLLPLLALPMALGLGRMGDRGLFVTQGLLAIAVYATAAALLVRARPWRSLLDLVLTLYLLTLLGALLMALVRFVAAPSALLLIAKGVIPAATFGLLQVETFAPLKLGFPDVARYLGLAVGFVVARWLLRRAGKAVGLQARPIVTPWPLRKGASEVPKA